MNSTGDVHTLHIPYQPFSVYSTRQQATVTPSLPLISLLAFSLPPTPPLHPSLSLLLPLPHLYSILFPLHCRCSIRPVLSSSSFPSSYLLSLLHIFASSSSSKVSLCNTLLFFLDLVIFISFIHSSSYP